MRDLTRLWSRRSLAAKLNLVMTVLVVATAAGVTSLSYQRERTNFEAELRQQAEVLLISLTMTSSDALYFQNRKHLVALASRLRDSQVVEAVRFFNPEGRPLADSDTAERELSLEIDPLAQQLIRNGSDKPLIAQRSDRLLAGRAVSVGGQAAGAISIELSMAPLRSKLTAVRNAGLGVAVMAVAAGSLLTLLVSRSLMKPLRLLVRGTRSISAGDLEGAASLEELGRQIGQGSKDEIDQLLVAEGQMVAYLREMSQVATAIARADLSAEVEPRSGSDAFGQAFRKMIESLRQLIGDVRNTAAQVASSAERISGSTSQISAGASSQSAATEEASTTLVEIASQIQSIARTVEELARTVDETAAGSQSLGSSIDHGAQEARTLTTAVDGIASTIAEMSATIRSTAGKVEVVDDVSRQSATATIEGGEQLSQLIARIGTSGSDIGKILQLIETIADSTTLLALNAAIQAARAGDAGRGFAVVAEEIKGLAQRSVGSTREISTIVAKVREDTEHAVGLTETVLKQIVGWVTRTKELVAEVSQEIQDQSAQAARILGRTEEIQGITQQLALEAEEQARGAQVIASAVQVMTSNAHQVADATHEQRRGGDLVVKTVEDIAQVASEHSAATDELSATTVRLAEEAERLHKMAATFKLDPEQGRAFDPMEVS